MRNPADSTERNVRAANKRHALQAAEIKQLKRDTKELRQLLSLVGRKAMGRKVNEGLLMMRLTAIGER